MEHKTEPSGTEQLRSQAQYERAGCSGRNARLALGWEDGPPELRELGRVLTKLISEANGVSLRDTLDLAQHSALFKERPAALAAVVELRQLLFELASAAVSVETLLGHPVAQTLRQFPQAFPQPFREEHIHLTGSLTAD